MEKYTEVIAANPKVELIHVSLDSSEDSAEEWAAAEKFPWLTVAPGDVERSDLKEYHTSGSVPFYTLVDGEGNSIATGSSGVFSKIAELGTGAE